MASNDIYIEKEVFFKILEEWKQKNNGGVRPMTEFTSSIGLMYLRTHFNNLKFAIEDQQKYFLAKIQYGI